MPLIIPHALPAFEALEEENIFVMREGRAVTQDIRPLKIAIVNLMPTKVATEIQLARVMSNTPIQVQLTLVRMDSHDAKNTDLEHLESFYKTFDEIKKERFDGMIITGAPVETIPFEEVDYWKELCEIMEYSKENVYSTMHVCWGAQAGMYYHFGIDKRPLNAKLFGVFTQKVTRPQNPLVRGFDEVFYAPHSRHTETPREAVAKEERLRILAESETAGLHLVSTENGRQIFVFGHQEYDRDTLEKEYLRDVNKGEHIAVPKNYYQEDDPTKEILFRWRSHGNLLFCNWLNYYVYQESPYDLSKLEGNES